MSTWLNLIRSGGPGAIIALLAFACVLRLAFDAIMGIVGWLLARRVSPVRVHTADALTAHVYGDSIDALKSAALREAAKLYGDEAHLSVEAVSYLATSVSRNGSFMADVRVRNLDGVA